VAVRAGGVSGMWYVFAFARIASCTSDFTGDPMPMPYPVVKIHAQVAEPADVSLFSRLDEEVGRLQAMEQELAKLAASAAAARPISLLSESPPDVESTLKEIKTTAFSTEAASDVAKAKASMEDFVASAANDVKAAREASAVSGEAAVEVLKRLRSYVAAGCPRNFTQLCPSKWTETDGLCMPAGESLCGPLDLRGATAEDLIALSFSCSFDYPCLDASPAGMDYSSCPTGWLLDRDSCIGPASKTAGCSSVIRVDLPELEKARAAARCGYMYPAKGGGPVASIAQRRGAPFPLKGAKALKPIPKLRRGFVGPL